jgi:hypothetical protein
MIDALRTNIYKFGEYEKWTFYLRGWEDIYSPEPCHLQGVEILESH